MAIGWNFPSNNFGTVNGIGEAGIETFKGSPYKSLAREICQNSLDAKIDNGHPVRVEFSCSKLSVDDDILNDFSSLKNAIEACYTFWYKQNNKKIKDFFHKALKLINSGTISLLRISDFNTRGLEGSDEEYNSPWQNLVKSAGVSDKSGSSGGSFGIGKSAPFACSSLRTILYSTQDISGLKATQGIAKLVSFEKGRHEVSNNIDPITTGTGYYGNINKNSAIKKCMSWDKNFTRKESGTDVFILGFNDEDCWETEIIASILDDFLVAIYNNALEVNVSNTLINKDTLSSIVEKYKDNAKLAYNYYQVLTSEKSVELEEDYAGLGNIEVHILLQNDLHRRVMMTRMNGMKVFDQKNFPSAIQFAGICILKDEKINEYFREMENPQHNAWEPERHSKKTQAKQLKQGLYKRLKEVILELGKKTPTDSLDAEGVGEYLPDNSIIENGSDNYEGLSNRTKGININTKEIKGNLKSNSNELNPENDKKSEDDKNMDDNTEGNGSKDYANDKKNISDIGTGYGKNQGDNAGTNGEGEEKKIKKERKTPEIIRKKINTSKTAIRIMNLDKRKNLYRLIFTPVNTIERAQLQFKLSGEQSNVDVNILSAKNINTGRGLKFEKNAINIYKVEGKKKLIVDFTIDYAENSSMEVMLYGHKG